ncbi:hypothetical protein [Marispirochaeta aestuarii]|uniref:hypothetical protein n=1 Tax=Marispirochaeta aestuarii TaxID=1963862 RepID=UPI0029C681C2|nr:hypothetical protein [Marispirochaeta aestuarii]
MKKLIIIAAVLAVLTVVVSAQTSGTLFLQGSVPEILEITVNAEPGSDALDLSVDASGVKVATVIERSNKRTGYTVTLESSNAMAAGSDTPQFVDTTGTASLNYSISYGGSGITLSSGSAVISDVSTKSPGSGAANDVAISYNGATDFPYEGTYSDTLTFTIAAK